MVIRFALRMICIFILYSSGPVVADPAIAKLVDEWISLESQSNVVVAEWENRKVILEQQISLLNSEIELHKKILEKNEVAQNEVDLERRNLISQQSKLEQDQSDLHRELKSIQESIFNIASQLPPPLQK